MAVLVALVIAWDGLAPSATGAIEYEIREIVRDGEPEPGGDGVILDLDAVPPCVDDAGNAFFWGRLGYGGKQALFRASPGGFARVAVEGEPAPGGGNIGYLMNMACNDAGELVFTTSILEPGTPVSYAIFSHARGVLAPLLRTGDPLPGSALTFVAASAIALGGDGQLAFCGFFKDRDGAQRDGVLRIADGVTTLLSARGDPAPRPEGYVMSGRASEIRINAAGDVLFRVTVYDPRVESFPYSRHLAVVLASGGEISVPALGEAIGFPDAAGALPGDILPGTSLLLSYPESISLSDAGDFGFNFGALDSDLRTEFAGVTRNPGTSEALLLSAESETGQPFSHSATNGAGDFAYDHWPSGGLPKIHLRLARSGETVAVIDLGTRPDISGSQNIAFWWDGYHLATPILEVGIDVRPGSDLNPVRPASRGVLPVALLGSESFDVSEVDPGSLGCGRNAARPVHAAGGHLEDVNRDGYADLVSHYAIAETGIAAGDAEACVRGELLDGRSFEACDAIATRP